MKDILGMISLIKVKLIKFTCIWVQKIRFFFAYTYKFGGSTI